WILFAIEAVAYGILILWTMFGTKHWGPEGPVGEWLVFAVPPIMLGIPLAVFLIGKSDASKQVATVVLALPLIQLVGGPIYSAFEDFMTNRRVAGDTTFFWPAQRKLAHALYDHNPALVKSLVAAAGDLNANHQGDSLFRFGLTNADKSPESAEIIRTLL